LVKTLRSLVLAALVGAVLGTASPAEPAAHSTVWHVVALGDSDTNGSGDPTGIGWAGRYARLLRTRLHLTVVFTNLAEEGKTSDVLLSELQSDPGTRAAVKKAQIVLVGIGGADLNAGDTRNEAGACKGTACYAADLRAFGRNLEQAAIAIRKLRARSQTVLRAITLPNSVPGATKEIPPFITPEIGVFQTTTLRKHICGAMNRHGGRCVDALLAFNGANATRNAYASGLLTKADCCYPSGKGQQLMAELVLKSGLAPLR
jgi:lysophospholipase L1-like esterase